MRRLPTSRRPRSASTTPAASSPRCSARFSDLQGPDVADICYATQHRQSAVRELCDVVDLLLVVGSKNSSNSNRLREIGVEKGMPSYLIADGSELDPAWLEGVKTVGLTAGASAPEELVLDVIEALRRHGPVEVEEMDGVRETLEFRLPAELREPGDAFAVGESVRSSVVGIPLLQAARIGAYVLRQHLVGRKRYPLVLMLEPLFRCNLACAGCGKIDYPDEILNQRLSYDECMKAIDECGAPVVSIAGGEPLLHREMPKIVEGFLARKKFVILCTNALLLAKKIDDYKPHPSFTWSIHLDGDQAMHDKSVCQHGVYDKAVEAIKLAKSKGFRVSINCTLFNGADPAARRRLLRRDEGAGARRHHRLARLRL